MIRSEIVADGTGEAFAATTPAIIPASAKSVVMTKGEGADPCNASGLIKRLKAREAEFVEREAALNAREAKLDVAAERIEGMMKALKSANASLAKTVSQVDGAQARDIQHLVTMYSTMKPKRAGQLFDEMDVAFASELLVRAKPEVAALILSNMDPKKAFTISVLIAQRNQMAPKN